MMLRRLILPVLLMLSMSGLPAHATTLAGTEIVNRASVSYIDTITGLSSTVYSNEVKVIVQAQEALVLTQGQSVTRPVGSSFALPHRLTNSGNTPTAYTLSYANLSGDDYDVASLTLSRDLNGNGMADSGEPVVANNSSITLNPGTWVDLVLTGVIPGATLLGKTAQVQLTAVSLTQQATANSTDSVMTANTASLQLTKIASNLAPNRGDEVTFTLTATNTGNTSAGAVAVTVNGSATSLMLIMDAIPANSTLVSIISTGGGMALYHQMGDPAMSYVTTPPSDLTRVDSVAYGFTTIASGQSVATSFKVIIAANAGGTMNNTAQTIYSDGVNPGNITTYSNTIQLTLPPLQSGIKYYSDATFTTQTSTASINTGLYIQTDAAACNLNSATIDTMSVKMISKLTGDTEFYLATETGTNTGIFRIANPVMTADGAVNPVVTGNGTLETIKNDTLVAGMTGCSTGWIESGILIDPSGVVFDSRSNVPLAGVTVSLIDVTGAGNGGNPGGPAIVLKADGVTPSPSTVVTGADGRYSFPLVAPSTYRLAVIPAGGYGFPSVLPPGLLPAGRTIDASGSYGGEFLVNAATGAVTIDLPLDAAPGTGLFVQKSASRTTAEVGDFVDYTVRVKNVSGGALSGITLSDRLPFGFVYQPGTTRQDGAAVADPAGGRGPDLSFPISTLADTATATFTYRARLGPGAPQGDGINRAQASSAGPPPKSSNIASVQVKVQGGVFSDKAYVLGKIYLDCNGNGEQDVGENGIPGVRLYLENGSFVLSDSEGKYSFYGLSARTHALKVDASTLPIGASMAAFSQRHAGDGNSRFIDLKNGELHRADFASDTCTPEILDEVRMRRAKGETMAAARAAPQVIAGTPRLAELQTLLPSLSGGAGFIDLKDQAVLPNAQTSVRVKGVAGARFVFRVNNTEIADSRVGSRTTVEDRQLEVWEYIGVDLRPGENILEIAQIDPFGNLRAGEKITVTAPGALARLVLAAPSPIVADGRSAAKFRLTLHDMQGTTVNARTPITLEASLGTWQVEDLNKAEPGVQTFIEGGTAEFGLLAPQNPGESLVRISSGTFKAEANFSFIPELRDMLAIGVIEGTLNLRQLSAGAFQPARTQDGFEQELRSFSRSSGDAQAAARSALFLKGKIKGEYLLTLAYDSDKEVQQKLFRDIQPDEFYSVYGDASTRGFDAQSASRLYVRVDKEKSYLLYGDFNTPTATPARSLGAYSRSLTGLRSHYEAGNIIANGFISRDRTRQVIEEFPANGTSGPFTLKTGDIVGNSEKIEIITRDRNQPAIVVKAVPQVRFSDYAMEPLSGRILFRAPVASLDADLNPIFIRVTYEMDQGGDDFWVMGADGQIRLTEQLEIGGSVVNDRNPQNAYTLRSINTTVKLTEKTTLIAEMANTDRESTGQGQGRRVELKHEDGRLAARLYAGKTDIGFDNPSAPLTKGRGEAGSKISYKLTSSTRLNAELLHSEDETTGGRRDGGQVALEHSFDNNIRLEVGVRHASQTAAPTQTNSVGAIQTTSLRTKLLMQLPDMPQATMYGEAEQGINAAERKMMALGGEYQFATRGRLYARHEFINSLTGTYGLNDSQRQNNTVFGLDNDYMQDGRVFSEYRARDAFSGRDAEAAIGLRNLWRIDEGVRLNTSFEQVTALSGNTRNEATAATGAIEYTRNPLWKGTARLELRSATSSDSLLNTLGLAYKLSRDWTFLGKNTLSIVNGKNGGAEQTREWLQLGTAYRETERNRLNGLAKYEYKYEEDSGSINALRAVHILSAHANYQPNRALTYTARYAGKFLQDNSNGISSNSTTHLVSARVTRDLGKKWDIGAILSTLFSGDVRSSQYGIGAEVGYLLKENMWVSAGYNFFGFTDKDLGGEDYTSQGVYLRLRIKFDESFFGK